MAAKEEIDWDDPLTEADFTAVREGDAEIERGEFVTWDELKRELDL